MGVRDLNLGPHTCMTLPTELALQSLKLISICSVRAGATFATGMNAEKCTHPQRTCILGDSREAELLLRDLGRPGRQAGR